MENKLFRNSVSTVIIITMIMSVFSVITLLGGDNVFGASEATLDVKAATVVEGNNSENVINSNSIKLQAVANPGKNKNTFPKTIKAGKKMNIWADGDRYSTIYSKMLTYKTNNDINIFTNGETYYEPASMTITHKKKGKRTVNFSHYTYSMYDRRGLHLNVSAGKYTISTKFRKCYVEINNGTYYDSVYLRVDDSAALSTKSNTFYVKSKIKFAYNKKKGKLSKSKRIKYLAPTKKYGSLPKPKAKKGYKFAGWYTKKSGGNKVTKNSKVPTANATTLYAKYKKK